MTMAQAVALLLALAVLVAWVRLPRAHRRDPRTPRPWRLCLLLALQPLLAAALYLVLFPPRHPVAPATLAVLTEGATLAETGPAAVRGVLLALPEARDAGEALRVPDLATALRQHPGTTQLRVIGAGLVSRDRDAAGTVALAFDPPPLPPGIVRLSPPRAITRGSAFMLEGRVEGVPGGQAELLDPAGRRVDATMLPEDGGFALRSVALEAGTATFAVRVRDAKGQQVATASVPLWIDAAVVPRVLLLAGAPNPDTRALRRWLVDAGAQVQGRIALGGGVQLGSAPLTDTALDEADLLIVDARAWSELGEAGRTRVLAAVRRGLGLLLRGDDALPADMLRGLRAPGFTIEGGAGVRPWHVPGPRLDGEEALRGRMGSGSRDAPFDPAQVEEEVPPLSRRAWRVQGIDAVALEPGADTGDAAEAPGWWRAEGRGRIGLWGVSDSYRLPLHGRADLYADLWSPAVATLARARSSAMPGIEAGARVGQRLAICAWPEGAHIEAPDGQRAQPIVDPASGARRCAGYWPSVAGWHRLRMGDAVRPFHVAAADADPTQRLAELREATLLLAAAPPVSGADATVAPRNTEPGRAWPWFLAWLLLAAFAWWFERSRLGLAAAVSQQDPPRDLR
ncbi:carboxypeptidase regulatory-like domain-containing protein [Luteimonas saliphila]|uniref:carboxypeptidase regulatory-like domain-containing protein n=1 Tax=Luteimonas saliphila TaxID=2804919 RepID=UPI00192E2212|nr:carboxypeptidase regulatory-like domain-containing protein [Luteimonas saliphila]